ncbi:MAG: SpoIIE family protein phosphatase [Planctomycetota bacterium]|nr:SpoIIE family protein phosphatase [Planctomycetota bacterium]MDA1137646.1 SpoIIE family protein phosphatase [Planctomycetota bacterium]
MRILIAEDNKATRIRLKMFLEKLGHKVLATSDGAEAWNIYQNGEYQMVITDWEMPELDGLGLVRQIRGSVQTGYVYIIMLTAKTEKQELVEAMEAGADDFLAKPFDPDELRVRLHAGERVIELERGLADRNQALEDSNSSLEAANAKMRRDLEAAAEIQKAFLPKKIPDCPGAYFSWAFHPCDELAGDTLNIVRLDENHVGLYVIDVSGHGVPAALLSVTLSRTLSPSDDSTVLKESLPGSNGYRIVPPAEVAYRLNQRFAWSDETEQYFTMAYGVLNIETNHFQFMCAGHPAPACLSRGSGPQYLAASGFPIGLGIGDYEDHTVELHPGDRIFFYSDGIPEAMDGDHEQFGEERLLSSLARRQFEPLEDSIAAVVAELKGWRGTAPVIDDVSLLGLEIA